MKLKDILDEPYDNLLVTFGDDYVYWLENVSNGWFRTWLYHEFKDMAPVERLLKGVELDENSKD